jgi:lipopolysaccharide export system protein LptA
MRPLAFLIPGVLALLIPGALAAQTDIRLGGLTADPSAPVEIAAERFEVDQTAGTALFSGNVVIGQGDMRIAAEEVAVTYNADSGEIARLDLTGQVTFVTATEAAEAASAVYDLASGELVLSGQVLLSQGASAISAERMVINLDTGTARMEGRVRTVFQQADN